MTENTAISPEVLESEEESKPKLVLVPSKITEGRDELNFAEFPLSALSDKSDPSVKTIYFEDKIFDRSRNEYIPRKVTITGSDAFGLPTPLDEEVLLALIQLSKLQGFRTKRVYFTRYQLIQILKWPVNGQNYARLEQALNRWMGVTMYYKNAWRDKKAQSWVDESFHMLERVKIFTDERHAQNAESTSYFEWNEAVFRSFQNGNVKALNYDFLLSIESSVAKRLFRFLDKRFHHSLSVEFELKALSYEHIGLSRNSPVADLKRKLSRAIDELEEKGFLAKLTKEERFRKDAPGLWKVIFRKAPKDKSAVIASPATKNEPTLEEELVAFGVRENKARELVTQFSQNLVREKLAVALFLKEKGDSGCMANPPGYLISSIEKNFEAPKLFKEETQQKEKIEVAARVSKAKALREEARREKEEAEEKRKRDLVDSYLAALTTGERELLKLTALKDAEPAKQRLIALGGKVADAMKQAIIDGYVLEILAEG